MGLNLGSEWECIDSGRKARKLNITNSVIWKIIRNVRSFDEINYSFLDTPTLAEIKELPSAKRDSEEKDENTETETFGKRRERLFERVITWSP